MADCEPRAQFTSGKYHTSQSVWPSVCYNDFLVNENMQQTHPVRYIIKKNVMDHERTPRRHEVFVQPRSRRECKPVVEVLDPTGSRTRRCTVWQERTRRGAGTVGIGCLGMFKCVTFWPSSSID